MSKIGNESEKPGVFARIIEYAPIATALIGIAEAKLVAERVASEVWFFSQTTRNPLEILGAVVQPEIMIAVAVSAGLIFLGGLKSFQLAKYLAKRLRDKKRT